MEVAKHIQTALLPKGRDLDGYDVAAECVPADEVGGDYYDVIAREPGEVWVAIGDVSGHGVESGLIMMMAQTSIATAIGERPGLRPSDVVHTVNSVLTDNISRLGADRYMTLSALVFRQDHMIFAGKHQDILVYRHARGTVETLATRGTWLGVLADVGAHVTDVTVPIAPGDVVLLFTDGVTEAANAEGELFGEERLESVLTRCAEQSVDDIVREVVTEVRAFMGQQSDDITVLALRRTDRATREQARAA
jgi:serine phosphatase RsbU (regulator of sigma subunit)